MAPENRLAREKSPYLLQHARNPVDWHPWGAEAFEEARSRQVPVFLSVGYSACHWCHVMERESFEDEEVARLLNASFVPVKVDREELPAVDHLYMAYCRGMTGGGGWPLTAFLDGQGRAFFAGTYFPRSSELGRPGMLEVLPRLAALWGGRRDEVLRTAEQLTLSLAAQLGPFPGRLDARDLADQAASDLERLYDPLHGGFGERPKFPNAPWLLFLLRRARTGEASSRARAVVEETLRAMRLGGIWDHVGHGFHRYATDAAWLVPHFEKMLPDQALLALCYAEAFGLWGEEALGRTATEILEYVRRDLELAGGGLAASEDADSDGEEGAFYLWTAAELQEVLGPAAAEFGDFFNVAPGGNFRGEAGEWSGRNILHRTPQPARRAADSSLPGGGLPRRIEDGREALLAARAGRERPGRDDKVLADWNGLAVAALARAGAILGDPGLVEAGARTASFVLRALRDGEGGLLHRWRDGEAAFAAGLDDHAFVAWGCLELHEATGERRWLEEALRLAEAMETSCGGSGAYYLGPPDPLLPLRLTVATDAATPSGNAVAAEVLFRVARLTGDAAHADRARRVLDGLAGDARRAPLGCASLLAAAMQPAE